MCYNERLYCFCIAFFFFKFVIRPHLNPSIWVARRVCSLTVLITRKSFSIFQDKQEEDKALLNKSRTDLKYVFVSNMLLTRWTKKRPQNPCQGKCCLFARYFLPPGSVQFCLSRSKREKRTAGSA